MLQALSPDANPNRRNAECDSCRGRIGGPRLFCLDCDIKGTELYNTLDLCCAPQCVAARVTHREDIAKAHEPNHRLVKVRTTVLTRSHGRVHTAACDAFRRVQETRRMIAELTSDSDEEGGSDERKSSSCGPTSTEAPAKSDQPDDELNPPDDTKGGAEVEGEASRDVRQGQAQDQSLPTCGKCNGSLSFPFWYCIFCEGQSELEKDQASHPSLISHPIHQKITSSSAMHVIRKAYPNSCAAPVSIPRSTISFAAWRRRRMMKMLPLPSNGSCR